MDFKKFKTERMLLGSIAFLFLFLFVSAFSKEIVNTNVSLADEVSGASGSNEGSQGSEGSEQSEGSEESEGSESSEESQMSEASVNSTASVKVMRTGLDAQELSVESSSEASRQSVEEASEASELSEESQEISEESIRYVEGYGEVVSKEGNIALVRQNEKLFFLIPVEVESQVTLGEGGDVVDEKKSFLNWLISVFSF